MVAGPATSNLERDSNDGPRERASHGRFSRASHGQPALEKPLCAGRVYFFFEVSLIFFFRVFFFIKKTRASHGRVSAERLAVLLRHLQATLKAPRRCFQMFQGTTKALSRLY